MGRPYKIVDRSGQNRYGVVVSSLQGLIKKAQEKLRISIEDMKVVLEADGTEVDEEEYFSTLEQNTCFMILRVNEDWMPPSEYNYLKRYEKDEVDGGSTSLVQLLKRIKNDAGQLCMLGGKELELLSDMDPESLGDIIPDRNFLSDIKEASTRFLNDRRDAKEALKLLKMYHAASNTMLDRQLSMTANDPVQ